MSTTHFLEEGARISDGRTPMGLREIMQRTVFLSQLDPTDIVRLASSEETGRFFDLRVPVGSRNQLLRSWNEVGRASANPLSEWQHAALLAGENVPDDAGTRPRSELLSAFGRTTRKIDHAAIVTGTLAIVQLIGFGFLHLLRPTEWLDGALFVGGVVLLGTLMTLLVSQRRRLNLWQQRMAKMGGSAAHLIEFCRGQVGVLPLLRSRPSLVLEPGVDPTVVS
jgi:hypothetical protein